MQAATARGNMNESRAPKARGRISNVEADCKRADGFSSASCPDQGPVPPPITEQHANKYVHVVYFYQGVGHREEGLRGPYPTLHGIHTDAGTQYDS